MASGRKHQTSFSVDVVRTSLKGTVVLKPKGSINAETVPSIQAGLDGLMKKNLYRIVLDLSQTVLISSAGVLLLLGAVSSLRVRGGYLILMNVPSHINTVLDVVNIRSYFPVIRDLSELEEISKNRMQDLMETGK